MRALLLTLLALGACKADSRVESRAELGSDFKQAPVIIVTKGEITYGGQLDAGAPASEVPSCTRVLEQLSRALFAYDPSYVALAVNYTPKVRASCQDDGWPDELKRCIVDATPQQLAHEHACEPLITDELRQKVAKRLGLSASTTSSTR